MKRFYNKAAIYKDRKPKFNPYFWEVPFDHSASVNLSEEKRLWYETPDDVTERLRRKDRVPELMPTVYELIDSKLTDRQRDIVAKYFIDQLTEEEIADELGISHQVVSQHLFGKRRGGKVVGGAIPKLRKEVQRLNLAW